MKKKITSNISLFLFLFCTSVFLGQQTVEDNFEGTGTISTWFGDDCGIDTAFSNPFQTGINLTAKVLKYTDSGGQYANVRFDTTANFDLSSNNIFSLKIYVSSADVIGNSPYQISLKLQNGNLGQPWSTQSEIIKPIVLDQWQTITFDFANDAFINLDVNSLNPTSRTDFNRVLLQVNGENNTDEVTAYIDDFVYNGTINVTPDIVFDNLVWSDEFDGTGAIDTNKWFHQIQLPNGNSWYNGEIQHYTDRVENSNVNNGVLNIIAQKEVFTNQGVTKNYTSARLNSKFAFKYGKVEIRAKLPTGVGTWPAIWMLGKNITEPGGYWANNFGTTSWPACGEIDIMEHWGSNQNFVQSAMHTPSSFGGTVNHGGQTIATASTEFHIYTLEWSSEKMVFKVDGNEHYTYNPANKNADTWPFDAEQYLLLNIAIQPSIVASFTDSKMEIDYVRVYQESTASVSNVNIQPKIVLFPNPLKDRLTLRVPLDNVDVKVTIFNLLGQKINSFLQSEKEKTYDFTSFNKGTYILKVESEKRVSLHKIIKL